MEYYIADKVKDILHLEPWVTAKMETDKKFALLTKRIYEQVDKETMLYKIRVMQHINNVLKEAI